MTLVRFGIALVSSILLLFGAVVWNAALSQGLPPGCGPSAVEYAGFLKKEFDEEPLWQGHEEHDAEIRIVMFVNPRTGTWTVIATKQGAYCIAKTGLGFKPAEKTFGPDL